MLKMPWQIIKYSPQEDKVDQPGYIVYYRGECSSSDELKFLLDYFFRFQLVGDKSTILIRAPFAVNEATSYFETAKEQYCQKYFGYKDIDSRLKKITLEKVICQQANFSTTELGMDPR
ncbi:hypothetical protein DB346_05440 [Verrucomicrobia bacterium LW23]|nr:hypothetical protein DB346_05440 [Verrucomicrobia bacterium LW23]